MASGVSSCSIRPLYITPIIHHADTVRDGQSLFLVMGPLPTNDMTNRMANAKINELRAAAIDIDALLFPTMKMATCRLLRLSRLATVNSPRTRATDRNAADSMAVPMLGTTIARKTMNQLAPRDRAASDSVLTSIALRPASKAL